MELWWIILACCGGGALLFAYVAIVVYKILRRKKRVQMNHASDPERLTDGKDWAVEVNANEVPERKVDGLCMDTISGSTKLRRKSSTTSPTQIPGGLEVAQSVPVVSPQTNSDKQSGGTTNPSQELHASTSASRPDKEAKPNATSANPRNSPEVVQSSEYTWESLITQRSDIRKKRSQSFHWNEPEYRGTTDTTGSIKYNRKSQAKRFGRSKSLRGYTQHEMAILSADGTVPLDRIVISVKREGEQIKRNKSKKSPKAQRTVTNDGNKVKKPEATKQNPKISRSGSAPSLIAKEKAVKNEEEGIRRRRNHSFNWIPEPDYQTVSIEELVLAAQQQVKAADEDNVCVVEIHNVPKDRQTEVSTSIGSDVQMVDGSPSTSIPQPSPSIASEDRTTSSTIIDMETIPPVPGIAIRVPTVLNEQTSEGNEEAHTQTRERKLSVKNRVQNFETQIVHAEPNSRQFNVALQKHYTPNTAVPPATDINNNSIKLPNWRQEQTTIDVREPNTNISQTGQPLSKSKPDARSIGKMNFVKHAENPGARQDPPMSKMTFTRHVETPAQNPQVTPQNPNRQDPPLSKMMFVKHEDMSSRNSQVASQNPTRQAPPLGKMNIINHVETPARNPVVIGQTPNRQDPSLNKMKITKHVETPAPQYPNSQGPVMSFDRSPSTQVKQLQETTLARNTTVLLRKAEEQRQNETSNPTSVAPPPPPPPPPPPVFTVDPRSSDQAIGNGVTITIESKDNRDASSEKITEATVPRRMADVNPTLEEKKKTWKKEQIVDQLHTARARNSNQNYIFGTGLAYQSCMPELQNKLKQLALAK